MSRRKRLDHAVEFPCEVINVNRQSRYVDIKYKINDPLTGELDERYYAIGRIPFIDMSWIPKLGDKVISVDNSVITTIVMHFEASKFEETEQEEEKL